MTKPRARMTCYQCGRTVTTNDDIAFVGAQPVHRVNCPKAKQCSCVITLTKTINELWAGDFSEFTDEEIVKLIQEDVYEFMDGATWKVIRHE